MQLNAERNAAWHFWLDIVAQSWLSLGDHRLRTLLSILGIAIGIAAVILIGTVSRGGKEVIFSELQTFGLKSVWVFRDLRVTDPRRMVRAGTGINNEDLAAIASTDCCSALANFTPVLYMGRNTSELAHAGGSYSQTRVLGVGSGYLEINNDQIVQGRGFVPKDIERRRNFIIIGEQVRWDLFGAQRNPIGQEIRLGTGRYRVIGVLEHKDRSLLASIGSAGGQDANSRVLLPYNVLQAQRGNNEIDVIQGMVSNNATANAATAQLISFLKRRHRSKYDYRAETMAQYVDTANKILGGVSIIGIVAASVSLLVAGLGILNIMSTSVLERTREIGLRKAIGGTEEEILFQFLLEAALISSIGGVVGLVLGEAVSVVMAGLAGFPFMPSPIAIIGVLGVAIAVGLISGFYPAYRAAKLRPVEALRYE